MTVVWGRQTFSDCCLGETYCYHPVLSSIFQSVTKVCMPNFSYILKGNSLTLCMLAYYHMDKLCIVLAFRLAHFEGVIAFFYLEYFIKIGRGRRYILYFCSKTQPLNTYILFQLVSHLR